MANRQRVESVMQTDAIAPSHVEAPGSSRAGVRKSIIGVGLMVLLVAAVTAALYTDLFEQGIAAVQTLDSMFFIFVAAGFVAQMIDGSLGMAYGVSASTFLMSFGVPPAAASASIHTAEIFTSGISGLTHLKFQNVNKKLFRALL